MNETNQFLEDIQKDNSASLEDMLGIARPETVVETSEEAPENEQTLKNRKMRRMERQLEEERLARIQAEARAQAILETKVTPSGEIDPLLLQLYGNEERGKEAALVHQQLLETYTTKAREAALQEFEAKQLARESEVKQFESFLDAQFEALEDDYNIDLSSNAPAARKARNELLELLNELSPKDNQGNITEYADINGVYKMYQLNKEKSGVSNRQKDLASRSMERTGTSPSPEKQPTAGFDGWRKDYGL